jgi:hypothetical protein
MRIILEHYDGAIGLDRTIRVNDFLLEIFDHGRTRGALILPETRRERLATLLDQALAAPPPKRGRAARPPMDWLPAWICGGMAIGGAYAGTPGPNWIR